MKSIFYDLVRLFKNLVILLYFSLKNFISYTLYIYIIEYNYLNQIYLINLFVY